MPRADLLSGGGSMHSENGRSERTGTAGNENWITPRRLAELRERIVSGFYDSPEVLDRVARRIFDSGELGRGRGVEGG
jgi:hypothetical protein